MSASVTESEKVLAKPSVADGTWIVIPSYNEATVLGPVLKEVLAVCPQVAVVDDGSSDNTTAVLRSVSVHRLKHLINLGQGAALQTGISYALSKGAKYVVTFDADGQMDPVTIGNLVQPLVDGNVDVVLGSRFLSETTLDAPLLKRLTLRLGLWFTILTTGLKLTDTHNGFRAFNRKAAEKIQIRQNRMAHASEIINIIAREKLRYQEVPVVIRYTHYSLAKGQRIHNSFNILWDLFFNK